MAAALGLEINFFFDKFHSFGLLVGGSLDGIEMEVNK